MKTGKTPNFNKATKEAIKTSIYITNAFHFPLEKALKTINSGMLGFYTNDKGERLVDKNTNKPIPITIARSTYSKYKEEFGELPELYQTLREFALKGYTHLIVGFQAELAYLHNLSTENMLALKDPLERQSVIDSLITKIIPAESAFADMLQEMIKDNPGMIGEITEDKKT